MEWDLRFFFSVWPLLRAQFWSSSFRRKVARAVLPLKLSSARAR